MSKYNFQTSPSANNLFKNQISVYRDVTGLRIPIYNGKLCLVHYIEIDIPLMPTALHCVVYLVVGWNFALLHASFFCPLICQCFYDIWEVAGGKLEINKISIQEMIYQMILGQKKQRNHSRVNIS